MAAAAFFIGATVLGVRADRNDNDEEDGSSNTPALPQLAFDTDKFRKFVERQTDRLKDRLKQRDEKAGSHLDVKMRDITDEYDVLLATNLSSLGVGPPNAAVYEIYYDDEHFPIGLMLLANLDDNDLEWEHISMLAHVLQGYFDEIVPDEFEDDGIWYSGTICLPDRESKNGRFTIHLKYLPENRKLFLWRRAWEISEEAQDGKWREIERVKVVPHGDHGIKVVYEDAIVT